MNNNKEFKRLNFFTGFFTTADDWNEGQAYHLEKRKLHNRLLHRAGIMTGLDADVEGGLIVIVQPGAALDNAGNLIYLASPETVLLESPASEPTLFYITIGYAEDKTDYDENIQDPDYSGFTRFTEAPSIKIYEVFPEDQIELARVMLRPGAEQITEPEDPQNPKENELDLRYRANAGSIDSEIDAKLAAAKERIKNLHRYYQAEQQRQKQGLHKPGVLGTVLEELKVVAAGDLYIRVLPGAALDACGRQLYLAESWQRAISLPTDPHMVYIAAHYDEEFDTTFADYLDNFKQPFSGSFNTANIEVTHIKPNNKDWIELARVFLEPNTAEIVDHHGDDDYESGVIDLREREFSSSICAEPAGLSGELQERVKVVMETTRGNFAALAKRFPSPAVDDVRHVALNIQMARDKLELHQLTTRIEVLAAIEQDVEHDLGHLFPPLTRKPEFLAYQDAIAELMTGMRERDTPEEMLTLVAVVAEAARDMSQVVFPPPVANAGPDQPITASGDTAVVTLDASGSQVTEGNQIVRYRWEKEQ